MKTLHDLYCLFLITSNIAIIETKSEGTVMQTEICLHLIIRCRHISGCITCTPGQKLFSWKPQQHSWLKDNSTNYSHCWLELNARFILLSKLIIIIIIGWVTVGVQCKRIFSGHSENSWALIVLVYFFLRQ